MKTEDYPIVIMAIDTQNGQVQITYNAKVTTGTVSLSITDAMGKTVKAYPALPHISGKVAFDAAELPQGNYSCALEYNGAVTDNKPFSINR